MSAEPRPAQLLHDSATHYPERSARRGLAYERTLLYQGPGIAVDLILREGADGVRVLRGEARSPITGQGLAGLLVRSHETGETAETDRDGRFGLGWESDRGALRLTVETESRELAIDLPPRSPR